MFTYSSELVDLSAAAGELNYRLCTGPDKDQSGESKAFGVMKSDLIK